MANPAPTINQINAFNATQGTIIDFNIIGGTELVRSNRIYIYDLSDNSLICTHLYVSTESIHELPPNTDGSIVYESGKSSADFVNGAQYYAQIQTFTDIAGTEGGSGLSVAKMFWCLVDPTLTITTIPSTISTTSYNVSATYNANTSVVSNIIQQYQFSLYSATGSLLQSSGVVVGSGTQQGTSTTYDISYNFTGLSVGSSYYVVVDVTTTQGMSVSAQSSTFTVSIDTPTLGEATVVNNACDGYISVTSNLSSEYGGSGSGDIVSFETDSENVFTKLQVDLEPIQEGTPWVSASDTEPYLMRISPQFNHDYNTEFDTLVGGTVAWNQKAYSLDTFGALNAVTRTYADGVATYTPTSYNASNGWYTNASMLTREANHVYYYTADINPDKNGMFDFGQEFTGGYTRKTINANQYTNISGISKSANKEPFILYLKSTTTAGWAIGDSFKVKNAMIFDLTQMFGSTIADAIYIMEQANAGDGVAFFRKYFSKAYYAYDAGTLMSVKTSAHKTTGKNLLRYPYANTTKTTSGITFTDNGDGSITANGTATATAYFDVINSSNPINIESGVYTYSVHGVGARLYLYVYQNGRWSGLGDATDGNPRSFTAQSNTTLYGFFAVNNGATVSNQKFYLQLEKGASATTYEPYVENVYPLDPNLELRGIPKLVDNKLQYDGDVYSSSGNVQRKYETITLDGNVTFYSTYMNQPNTALLCSVVAAGIKPADNNNTLPSLVATIPVNSINGLYTSTETGVTATGSHDGLLQILIKDKTTANDVKTYLSSNPITVVYEKTTPTTETAMPFEANQSIVPNGSEEYIDNRTVPIPVGHLTSYADVFPIMGYDSVDVEQTGVNVWDEEWELGALDGSGANRASTTEIRSKNYIPIVGGKSYYLYCSIASTFNYKFYDGNKTFISGSYIGRNSTLTVPSNARFMRFFMGSAYGTTYNNNISINYPSTDHDYHAYQGQSYHQEIEVTYTPTVQENDVYLFKQTGDVGGDRETIELVGGTVAWNQLVYDGNFTNVSRWNALSGATRSVSNNEIVINISSNFGGITSIDGDSLISGHKYLCTITAKASNARTNSVGFGLSDSSSNYAVRKVVSLGTSYETLAFVGTQTVGTISTGRRFMVYDTKGATGTPVLTVKNAMAFDLTAMFGTTIADYIYSLEQANAGAGVAFFRSLFPKPYYAYNAGELMSVQASSHDMVGFNAWDEEWELGGIGTTNGIPYSSNTQIRSKNLIKVLPNTTYYIKQPSRVTGTYLYDANGGFISYDLTGTNRITTPSNAMYLRLGFQASYGTTYKNDICINISDASKNGTYEPYVENTYPLDADLELRGMLKLDASNNLYYDGDTYKHDGSVNRKFGKVDLGTLTWQSRETTALGLFIAEMPRDYAWKYYMGGICSKYQFKGHVTGTSVAVATLGEDGCGLYYSEGYTIDTNPYPFVYVYDTSLSNYTTEQVKSAMNGVTFAYELNTPTTETADAFEEIQKVTPIYGTEEFVDSRTVPMPVYAKTQYLTRDVYGGYIDLVSGVLVVTRKLVTLDGTQTIYMSSNNRFYCVYDDAYAIDASTQLTYKGVISDRFKSDTWAGLGTNGGCSPVWTKGIAWRDDSITTVADWKTYFTNNPTQFSYELATPQTYQLTPQQIQTLVGVNNVWSEQGDVELSYHIPITNLLVKRQDVGDVSGDWLTLYSQPITQASDMDFTFIDFTNQYGKTYKYALVPLLTQTQSGVEVEVEGGYTVSDEVQSVFDGVFIVDSTGSQKCKANVGYGNVDMNQAVGTITPIGAKYPVVITNSKNQYHNGSISGTIVPDDYYFNGNLSRIDMVNKRDELEQFLTNKRAKIIKDWNGKIWLVMIMDNVSCTFNNNYGMGIVNFSTNWVEVGDPTNQQDLQATGLIDVGGV